MTEMLFQIGIALACAVAVVASITWVVVILPDWLRRRRERKAREAER